MPEKREPETKVSHSRFVVDDDDGKDNKKKRFRPAWKDHDLITFNLSINDYRHAVMGWCKFLIKAFVEPYSKLEYGSKFVIKGENGEYICRVDDVSVFDSLAEAVNEDNYRRVWPDASLMSLDRVRYLASIQVYNSRYREHIRKHGAVPKVMVINYSLHTDPRA